MEKLKLSLVEILEMEFVFSQRLIQEEESFQMLHAD